MTGRPRYEQIGQIGIDSGIVYIGDPCYVTDWDGVEPECKLDEAALSKQLGELTAVIAQTGYGDGSYPVFARIKDGRIMQITIDFELGPR